MTLFRSYTVTGGVTNDTILFIGDEEATISCGEYTVGGNVADWIADLFLDMGDGRDNVDLGGLDIGACWIEGGNDVDYLVGCSCPTSMVGGEGNDTLIGRSYSDACNGGGGIDTCTSCESRSGCE